MQEGSLLFLAQRGKMLEPRGKGWHCLPGTPRPSFGWQPNGGALHCRRLGGAAMVQPRRRRPIPKLGAKPTQGSLDACNVRLDHRGPSLAMI